MYVDLEAVIGISLYKSYNNRFILFDSNHIPAYFDYIAEAYISGKIKRAIAFEFNLCPL